jgi:hypothetical protein
MIRLLEIGQTEMIIIAVLSIPIQLLIFYLLIKGGVRAGNKDLLNQIHLLNRFKMRELKNSGVTDEEIQSEINIVFKSK